MTFLKFIAAFLQALLKIAAAWVAFSFAQWVGLPEWATLAVTIMAVESARVEIKRQ